MKSTIRIKTDYSTESRIPIIDIKHIESDDPRDLMLQDFLNMVGDNAYLCIMEHSQHPEFTFQLRPIPSDDALWDWWRKYTTMPKEERDELKFRKCTRGSLGIQSKESQS
jgi:hypothetical protein